MDQKQQILTQAKGLFMRYGAKSVTMDDVARHMGMSKKTIYQYVDNKADLIDKIMRQYILEEKAAIDQIAEQAANAVEEMLNIAKFITMQLRELSPQTLYDLQKYYYKSWKLMESLHQEYVYLIISNNLKRGIEEGLYREDLSVDIVAKLYVGKSLLVVDEEMFPLRNYNKEKLFSEFIKYHFHGIASPKGLRTLAKLTKP